MGSRSRNKKIKSFAPKLIPLIGVLCSFLFIGGLPKMGETQDPLGGSHPLHPTFEQFPPSTYEGSPQVFCATQGAEEGVWFGTSGSVHHYTGEEWRRFKTTSGSPVLDIDSDPKGRIWLGGSGEFGYLWITPSSIGKDSFPKDMRKDPGRILNDRRTEAAGQMEFVSLLPLLPDSLKDFDHIWQVHALADRIYFNSHSHLFMLKDDSLHVIEPPGKSFYSSKVVNGSLLIQDPKGPIYRVKGSPPAAPDEDPSPYLEPLPGSEALANKAVNEILDKVPGMTSGEDLLVITMYNGLYRCRLDSSISELEGRVEPIEGQRKEKLKAAELYGAISLTPSSNPWGGCMALNTRQRGILLLDTNARIVKVLDKDAGMTSDMIWGSTKAPSGSGMIWSATNKGITRWELGDPRTFAWEGKSFDGSVNDLLEQQGNLYTATHQGVYVRKQERRNAEEWKRVPGTKHQSLDLLSLKDEEGSQRGPLVAAKSLLEVRMNGKKADEVNPNDPYTLTRLPIPTNEQWIAQGGRGGLVILSKGMDGDWKEILHLKGSPKEIISLQPELSQKKRGNDLSLWVGLRNNGGFRLELDIDAIKDRFAKDGARSLNYEQILEKGREDLRMFPFIGKEMEKRAGLPSGPVRFFSFDERIVVGTNAGLYKPVHTTSTNKQNEEVRFVPDTSLGCLFGSCARESSPDVQQVFRLQEEEDGSIWLSSNGRVLLANPKEGGGYRIDSIPFKGMGVGSAYCFFTDRKGVVWIGGDNGTVRYDPTVEKDFQRVYPCLIKEVTAPLKDTGRDKKDSVLFGGYYRKPSPKDPLLGWQKAYEQPEAFVPTLSYSMNGLSFRFAAPYYEDQGKLKYSYQLSGFDQGWSEWQKEPQKEYTNLPEGSYTFKVKAKNVYDIESKVGEYRFRILPPWYRTWTAYGGYMLAGLGSVWLIVWLNSRRLMAQKQRLERTVEERTQEIREQKEEVEKKNAVITQQKEKVEEAHREITASIDYAQKIQNALLQSEEYASDHLPEHFILFKPQATVSGDFYWAKERNGYLYFAAIDCTGHGVPGAFMSMLGINQLNEIMAAKDLPSPGEILTDLRERVVAELRSGDPQGGAKDGMDAAMVKIPISAPPSSKPKKVEFAGANNPLYVVKEGIGEKPPSINYITSSVGATHVSLLHGSSRSVSQGNDNTPSNQEDRIRPFKKSSDGFEVKGDKMAVGYEPDAAEAFTTAELEVPPDAMLYIFSDGYADQFGGPKGKKFRYGPFKELLVRIHTMAPEEQKQELDRVFEEWKGGQEQVDDVCVVGVRV